LSGSPYAGALSVHQNPASFAAYQQRWDVTAAGFNIFLQKNNFLQIPTGFLNLNIENIKVKEGQYERFFRGHSKISILNAVMQLKKNGYIAAGINIRLYGQLNTSALFYSRNLNTSQFLAVNKINNPIEGRMVTNNWVEGYFTYGRKIAESESDAWIAGATLKLMRGSFGFNADIRNFIIVPSTDVTQPEDFLTQVTADYHISRNIERFDDQSPRSKVISELLSGTGPTPGIDLGIEYVRYKTKRTSGYYVTEDKSQYDFRIGASITDIGRLSYQTGVASSIASNMRPGITGTVLDSKFPYTSISDFSLLDFTDSLTTVVNNLARQTGKFALYLPAKFIVTADKSFSNNLYLGTQIVVPLTGNSWTTTKHVSEIAHILINPRWETSFAGLYIPVMVTIDGQAMVGAAIRLGPILAGIHDFGSLSSRNDFNRGGYYMAISIKPFDLKKRNRDCPEY
jgi:hypothetical protein